MMRRGPAVRSALLRLFLLLLPLLYGCATLPYDYPRTLSTALYLPEATAMGKKIQPQVAEHQGASGFYLLSSGEDAFLARVRLIDRAEKTLDLQYYLFSPDLTGKYMLDRIVAAAASFWVQTMFSWPLLKLQNTRPEAWASVIIPELICLTE